MPEETVKPIEKPKSSDRERSLENALKNGIIVVENLLLIIKRMGMRSQGSEEWLEEAQKVLK